MRTFCRLTYLAFAVLAVAGTVGGFLGTTPVALKLLVGLVAALSFSRPPDGLVLLAALGPLGGLFSVMAGTSVSWTVPFMLAFVGGASAHHLRDRSDLEDVPVLAACLFWAAVVVSSVATLIAVRLGPSEAPGQLAASFFDWLVHRYPMVPRSYPGVSAAFLAAGAGALFALASVLCRRTVQLADKVTLALLVSVSVLGALSVNRLVELALARPPVLTSIVELHRRLRISAAVPDLNAAGALFLLLIPVACDLLWTRGRRLAAALMLPWLLAGLWLTGSRTALVMLPVGLAVLILIRTRDTARVMSGTRMRVALLACLICATALVVALYPRVAAHQSAGRAVSIREDLVTTSFRMARAHPLFGVGIGNYQQSSPDFMPVRLMQYYRAENAHNQVLQVLGELGVVGLAAFVTLVTAGLFPAARALWRGDTPPLLAGLAVGTGSFLIAALGMHPLLIPEVAMPFFLVVGLTSGTAPLGRGIGDGAAARIWKLAAAAAILCVVSVPLRVRWDFAHPDLRGLPLGLSEWKTSADGRQYRSSDATATIFVPTRAARVRIPLRARGTQQLSVNVELSFDGGPPVGFSVPVNAWRDLSVVLPPGHGSDSRLRRLDLRWVSAGEPMELDVGRETWMVPQTTAFATRRAPSADPPRPPPPPPPPGTLTVTALTANRTFPSILGEAITFTAAARGGTPPLQYEFWRLGRNHGGWVLARPYGASNTYTWTPTTRADIDTHVVQVWVRSSGSVRNYEAWKGTGDFAITGRRSRSPASSPSKQRVDGEPDGSSGPP
jgi:O-antigen ligase